MTETVVPSGNERSNLSRARDYKPDRNTRGKERHRDGDCSRARETHHRQFPVLPQPSYHHEADHRRRRVEATKRREL